MTTVNSQSIVRDMTGFWELFRFDMSCIVDVEDEGFRKLMDMNLCSLCGSGVEPGIPKVVSITDDEDCHDSISDICEDRHRVPRSRPLPANPLEPTQEEPEHHPSFVATPPMARLAHSPPTTVVVSNEPEPARPPSIVRLSPSTAQEEPPSGTSSPPVLRMVGVDKEGFPNDLPVEIGDCRAGTTDPSPHMDIPAVVYGFPPEEPPRRQSSSLGAKDGTEFAYEYPSDTLEDPVKDIPAVVYQKTRRKKTTTQTSYPFVVYSVNKSKRRTRLV